MSLIMTQQHDCCCACFVASVHAKTVEASLHYSLAVLYSHFCYPHNVHTPSSLLVRVF
jgi:hypothetical protein